MRVAPFLKCFALFDPEQFEAQLVTDALIMAIRRRGKPDALAHHSTLGYVSPIDFARQAGRRSGYGEAFQPYCGNRFGMAGRGPISDRG